MKVSTRGRYALRMMIDLALNGQDTCVPLRDIAVRQEVSMKYMEQIVGMLTKAGMLYSVRGPQGGYRLARSPQQYTIAEILVVTEGDLAPIYCVATEKNPCERAPYCATLPFWEGLKKAVLDYAKSITLKDLVDQAE